MMDQSAYSYTTVSDSHYFSTEVHGTSTTDPVHQSNSAFFYQAANQPLAQQNMQATETSWSYTQLHCPVQQATAGVPINVNHSSRSNMPANEYSLSQTGHLLQSPPLSTPLYTEKTNNLVNNSCGSLPYSDGYPFGNSDVAGNEIYLGQPVLHTLQPPEQIPNVSAFPATTTPHTAVPSLNIVSNGRRDAFEAQPVAAASDEKVKRAPVVSAPQRSRGKVLDGEDEDGDDDDDDDDVSDDNNVECDDPSKDPSWSESDEEEEEDDDFFADLSGSDEDYVVAKRRRKSTSKKPRKKDQRRSRRVTRSSSKTSTNKRQTRSSRHGSTKNDDLEEEDDLEVLPIKGGQPSLSSDSADDQAYAPTVRKGSRAAAARPVARSTRRPAVQAIQIQPGPDKLTDDSPIEEITLHEGQPLTNLSKASKCANDSEAIISVQKEQRWAAKPEVHSFVVERESAEAIMRIPNEDNGEEHCIWEVQTSLLRKYTRVKGTNHFQATSSYLGNFGDVRDRFLPLTVQRTKRSEVKLVRLLGVGQSAVSGVSETSEQSPAKKKRGRPRGTARSVSKPRPAKRASRKRRRGRGKRQDAAPVENDEVDKPNDASVEDVSALPGLEERPSSCAIVKDYVREMLTTLSLEKDRADVEGEAALGAQLNSLQQRLLDDSKLDPDYLACLCQYSLMVVEKCNDDRDCQALLAADRVSADRAISFLNKEDEDGARVKFFVCQSVGERSKMWHTIHNYKADILSKCKVKLLDSCNSANAELEPLTDSSATAAEAPAVAKAVLGDIIDRVEADDEVKHLPSLSSDAATNIQQILNDQTWIGQLQAQYEAIVAAATSLLGSNVD